MSGQLTGQHSHDHQQQQQQHYPHMHGRNGYLSDVEGYILQQNQRVSRSGKYGSQASSPRSDHRHHPDDPMMNDSEEDDDEDDDEEEEEEDDDEDIEAEIHMNDMKAAEVGKPATVVANPGGVGGSGDVIVSYSAFQAEAAATLGPSSHGR